MRAQVSRVGIVKNIATFCLALRDKAAADRPAARSGPHRTGRSSSAGRSIQDAWLEAAIVVEQEDLSELPRPRDLRHVAERRRAAQGLGGDLHRVERLPG